MITIQRTVDIPADRRIFLDIPDGIPEGRVTLEVTLTSAGDTRKRERRILDWILHPVQSYRSAAWAKTLGELDEYRRAHGQFFGGMDGLEYQRKLRDEWPD
jgi:hypothetical protein